MPKYPSVTVLEVLLCSRADQQRDSPTSPYNLNSTPTTRRFAVPLQAYGPPGQAGRKGQRALRSFAHTAQPLWPQPTLQLPIIAPRRRAHSGGAVPAAAFGAWVLPEHAEQVRRLGCLGLLSMLDFRLVGWFNLISLPSCHSATASQSSSSTIRRGARAKGKKGDLAFILALLSSLILLSVVILILLICAALAIDRALAPSFPAHPPSQMLPL